MPPPRSWRRSPPAGAFDCLGLERREAIWLAGAAADDRSRFLPGTTVAVQPPLFADQTSYERLSADLWATGVSTDDHPMAHFREALRTRGVLTAADLQGHEVGRRIEVAGLVTHRQRPATASGITFVNLEDESGLVNIVCSAGVWNRYRRVARNHRRSSSAASWSGRPRAWSTCSPTVSRICAPGVTHRSRDFR